MEGVTSQSTPTLIKRESNSDMTKMIQFLCTSFNKFESNVNEKLDIQNDKFDAIDKKFESRFDELRIEISKVHINCESTCNKLKYELNEILSHAVKNISNRVDKIESNVGEKFDKQRQKVFEKFECKTEDDYNDMCENAVVESKITNNNDIVENNENNNIIENGISEINN